MSARIRPGWLSALALLAPAAAQACAVCGGGNPANRAAFLESTVALSLLPLGMFVGAFLWLRSRLADRGRREFDERDGSPGRAAPEPGDRDPREP